jgi:hypothetical protein
VASTSQRGAVASFTEARSTFTAIQLSAANSSTAPAKPPTAMRPSFRSLLAAISKVAKPATPMPSTAAEAGLRLPTSRRITRSGGTCASCSTGGRPKANSSVRPMPRPKATGHNVAAGRLASTSPDSSSTNTKCTAKPSATPRALAARPTSANSRA